ncbi:MAG: hypothetical protein mread185_000153 [Mycoplasmataceae bacterium]|nr:MAG: hypothetical protein mread185_000153 [Mycoplasmataceae bacterium]
MIVDRFFEYLINKLYWEYRKTKNLSFGSLDNEPVIRFGGFDLEKPYWNQEKNIEVRRGWHTREPLLKMGSIPVYTRTIYLNELFLHRQMGLQTFYESQEEFNNYFNFESLIEVISHELAHAILTDTQPHTQEINGGHGKEHDKTTEELRQLLISFSEYEELKNHW